MQKKLTRLVFLSTLLYAVFCSAALFCFLNEKQDTILIYAISGLLVLLICGWLSAYFGYKNVLLTLFVCNLLLLYIFADIIYDFNSSMVFFEFLFEFLLGAISILSCSSLLLLLSAMLAQVDTKQYLPQLYRYFAAIFAGLLNIFRQIDRLFGIPSISIYCWSLV